MLKKKKKKKETHSDGTVVAVVVVKASIRMHSGWRVHRDPHKGQNDLPRGLT